MQVILIPLRPVLKLCLERTKIDVLEGYFFLYWNLSSCSLLWKIPFSVQVLPIWLVRTCKSVQLVWSLEIVHFKTFHCVCVEGGVGRCRCQVSPYACAVQYRAKILYIFLRFFLCISLLELCPITSSSLSRPKCQLSLLTQLDLQALWPWISETAFRHNAWVIGVLVSISQGSLPVASSYPKSANFCFI